MSITKTVRPCIHPRCHDQDGNPRLAYQPLCDSCANHLHRQINWLRDDYLFLKAFMPKPARTEHGVRTGRIEYGHPSEWATDTCRTIAKVLNRTEDDIRDELHDKPPANIWTAREQHLVTEAHRYLTTNWQRIITNSSRESLEGAATDIHELHRTIRRTLGYTRERQHLDGIACPACDTAALVRSTGQIDCEACGIIVTEDRYPLLTRIVIDEKLDELLHAYDTRHADTTP